MKRDMKKILQTANQETRKKKYYIHKEEILRTRLRVKRHTREKKHRVQDGEIVLCCILIYLRGTSVISLRAHTRHETKILPSREWWDMNKTPTCRGRADLISEIAYPNQWNGHTFVHKQPTVVDAHISFPRSPLETSRRVTHCIWEKNLES
jgi:hypothetical protein